MSSSEEQSNCAVKGDTTAAVIGKNGAAKDDVTRDVDGEAEFVADGVAI